MLSIANFLGKIHHIYWMTLVCVCVYIYIYIYIYIKTKFTWLTDLSPRFQFQWEWMTLFGFVQILYFSLFCVNVILIFHILSHQRKMIVYFIHNNTSIYDHKIRLYFNPQILTLTSNNNDKKYSWTSSYYVVAATLP